MAMFKNEFNKEITWPEGMDIDLEEGWHKIISRQFSGQKGRSFGELIQNQLDSYSSSTPWEQRFGEITSSGSSMVIRDYGEGMSIERLRLLATLGGTDKKYDSSKIGKFGIGFFSIFNPALGTKSVSVITKCEGHFVEMVFHVDQAGKRPEITTRVLDRDFSFSTEIKVDFDNEDSPGHCLEYARHHLKYYPCSVLINGNKVSTVWEDAHNEWTVFIDDSNCDGFLREGDRESRVTVLCQYEKIIEQTIPYLFNDNSEMHYDLRDCESKRVPFVPDIHITINSNDLNVTIGRDSVYMDSAFHNMLSVVRKALMQELGRILDSDPDPQLVLANQYIFRDRIQSYLNRKIQWSRWFGKNDEEETIKKLAEAKVYRLNSQQELYSLADLKSMLSSNTPLYFSQYQNSLRWLGGEFKHDFIILPEKCRMYNGAPGFYGKLFEEVFEDTVNLDTIRKDQEKTASLVKRGIISEKALSPECTITGYTDLNENEKNTLANIDRILNNAGVMEVIARQLHMKVTSVKSVFFDVDEDGITIASGLFDEEGNIMDDSVPKNMRFSSKKRSINGDILLGIRRNDTYVQALMASSSPHFAYYMLTYLASELALCQQRLVPGSSFYHQVKDQLASDMRKALMKELIISS